MRVSSPSGRRPANSSTCAARAAATSVYFCLAPGERSNLHRIKADEIWHFYDGTGLNIHCFFDDLTHRIIPLGRNFEAGELFQAVSIINQVASRVPAGEVSVKASGYPAGEYHSRCEQPRGEVIHYVKADGTRYLQRYRVRTPTFANLPPLLVMLPGMYLSDVPVVTLSIDPCISCTER